MAVPDDLVASDLTQAIVLAGVRHEETLAQFDEGPKRKSKWSECKVFKKGKRWGLPDDKPYKPLPYVDLPIGLMEKEIDQFLREQRLEDLHRKIQAHDLEDVEADIRPPSPPPVYDKAGNRLNTRDIRIRKAMTAEYNRLVRYMIKHVDGYLPPVDWKPAKLLKKIIIPIEKFPQAPFMGVIIGPRGVNHRRLQETTGCKIFIRGRDIGDKWQSDEEAAMPQHVHIEGDTEEQILMAERLIEPLLNPESAEFEYARTHGMQQLAMVNGFSLNKAEQRCGICGALGHLGYECPETNNQNYKMANVTCTICGDKGHVAADCKKAADQNKRDNVDWKAMAEKKAQMDKGYNDLMSHLGNLAGDKPPPSGPMAGNPDLPPPMPGPMGGQPSMPPPMGGPGPNLPRPPGPMGGAPNMPPMGGPMGGAPNLPPPMGGPGPNLPRPPGPMGGAPNMPPQMGGPGPNMQRPPGPGPMGGAPNMQPPMGGPGPNMPRPPGPMGGAPNMPPMEGMDWAQDRQQFRGPMGGAPNMPPPMGGMDWAPDFQQNRGPGPMGGVPNMPPPMGGPGPMGGPPNMMPPMGGPGPGPMGGAPNMPPPMGGPSHYGNWRPPLRPGRID